jgi:predicted transcriptional regulator
LEPAVVIHLDEATVRRVKALARRRHQAYQALLAEFVVAQLDEVEHQAE